MQYLVLGGTGFIGTHLSRALLAAGHRVRTLSRRGTGNVEGVEHLQGDFTQAGILGRALEDCDACIHLVATSLPHSSNLDPVADVEGNVIPAIRLAQLALERGVGRIVFVSSGGTVYGRPVRVPIDEGHPTDPLCAYGISKLAVEKFLRLYSELHGLDTLVLRVANPFGEGQRTDTGQGAIAHFLARAIAGEEIQVWGDGSVVRDYVYIGDVVDALVQSLGYGGPERVFNIGSGSGLSINQILDAIDRVVERRTLRRYMPGRKHDVPVNVLDINRARNELRWEPSTPFESALERTAAWIRAQAQLHA